MRVQGSFMTQDDSNCHQPPFVGEEFKAPEKTMNV